MVTKELSCPVSRIVNDIQDLAHLPGAAEKTAVASVDRTTDPSPLSGTCPPPAVASTSVTAPLLGFLGTVTGMIASFGALADFGTSGSSTARPRKTTDRSWWLYRDG